MTDMTETHEGGCLCGASRYAVTGEPLRVTVCHCTYCQRRTGSAFAVEAVFDKSQVSMTAADVRRYRHISDESGRWLETEFCANCGTTIGLELELNPAIRLIDAGTFDDPTWISADRQPFRHIFVRSKRNWSDIPDGVEQYQAHYVK